MIKHTVLILTYNQDKLISQTLESVLYQKSLPFEVIISDDHSTDNTFEILNYYKLKYPSIIKLFRQERNLGIFGNQNFLINQVSGDIVTFLAGDDLLKSNLFLQLNKFILKDKINLNSHFVIVTNTTTLHSNGNEIEYNNFKNRHKNVFQLRLRDSINYRSVGISVPLLKKVGFLPLDLGYHADWLWNLRIDFFSEKHYFLNIQSSTYRMGLGVISQTKQSDLIESRLKVLEIVQDEFKEKLKKVDIYYLRLEKSFLLYRKKNNIKSYIKLFSKFLIYMPYIGCKSGKYLQQKGNFYPRENGSVE
jgi:glycosyltransferase involved in cell wall biosynthesis